VSHATPLAKLIELLRCPLCGGEDLTCAARGGLEFELGESLSDEIISCAGCSESFPITADGIPILWSRELRQVFSAINTPSASTASDALAANVAIYDEISDSYAEHTHRDPKLARRIKTAVQRLQSEVKQGSWHIDFGCGPGHVLEWVSPLGYEQVGLDVSLANLRNVKKSVGCFVVCGDAGRMPFRDDVFDLVTECSALHHVEAWQSVVSESCRVCSHTGGVLIDNEPTAALLAWSPLAIAVFNLRFPVYKALSYFRPDKYMFRDTERAKRNLAAEVHNQPGRGFAISEVEAVFSRSGFEVEVIRSPTPELKSVATPNWKMALIGLLSARNPWNPRYGGFTALGRPRPRRRAS
jgi:ubiquinone/menaquinone biosynthesis C-methylase UbiE/uncharacterized protein YbaR (Trm112 family)